MWTTAQSWPCISFTWHRLHGVDCVAKMQTTAQSLSHKIGFTHVRDANYAMDVNLHHAIRHVYDLFLIPCVHPIPAPGMCKESFLARTESQW
jgi:hypothetical protein